MSSHVNKLMRNLLNDGEYKEYITIYKEKQYVDKSILNNLLKRYLDLYYLFLKINILLYRYDTKSLNNELKDYTHYKGDILYIDDIDIIMSYYFNNYSRCRIELSKIIVFKLRPNNEIKILKQILDRQFDKEIKPLTKYDKN